MVTEWHRLVRVTCILSRASFMSTSVFLSAIFCSFSVMRIPLPTFHSFRTNPSDVLPYPTGSKLKLFSLF